MSRGTQTFKQRDVVRAVRAIAATGQGVARVEIAKDGRIVVVIGKPAEQDQGARNEWDEVR